MARVKVYAIGDNVTYTFGGTEYRARIVETHAVANVPFSGGFEYTIRIVGNRGMAYRSGNEFRTTAQFLSGKPKPKARKRVSAKKRAESRDMAKLKEMHKQLMS